MAQFQLQGFALVVGAAGGIGRETAFAFAEAGVKGIMLADIDAEGAAKAAEETKGLASNAAYQSFSTKVDVTDVQSVDAMVKLAVERFGRVDYCINAFGVDLETYVPMDETAPEEYDRLLGINTKGVFLVTRAAARAMKTQKVATVSLGARLGSRDVGRGSIVNISSAMALVAVPGKAPYATSKHAVTGLTKAAAMDYKSYDIRTNQICPTWVRTPMWTEECRKAPAIEQLMKSLSHLKRAIEPDEVAAACVYLCSPGAMAINGSTLTMDTGITAGPMIG